MADDPEAATRQRVHTRQRELLEWEEGEVRGSLVDHVVSARLHAFSLEALGVRTAAWQGGLRDGHRFVLSAFEQLLRDAVATLEAQRMRCIAADEGVDGALLREAERRRHLDRTLSLEHADAVLSAHHALLCADYLGDLNTLRAARDAKLAEEMCRALAEEEQARRGALAEQARVAVGAAMLMCREAVARAGIGREQRRVREAEWRCPICAERPPARSSMLAEHPLHPIRGEDTLQMHLLHHAADVARRNAVRNATLREEAQLRAAMAATALTVALSLLYDYRRGVVLLAEESARARRFMDPAAWRASIRAAIEATARRQLAEQEAVRLAEQMGRLLCEEECLRSMLESACQHEVLECPFFLTRRENVFVPPASPVRRRSDEDGSDDDDDSVGFTAVGASASSPAVFAPVHVAVPGVGVICRKNITTVRRLFEIRLQLERPLPEDERALDAESHLTLPTLPTEASHVRRKMGAEEVVPDADRFLFGAAAAILGSKQAQSPRADESAAAVAIADSLDALFSRFGGGVGAAAGSPRRGSASRAGSAPPAAHTSLRRGEPLFGADYDAAAYGEDDDALSLGLHSSDDDGLVSEASDDLFELEIELDELQRKESGSRRLVVDLEWQRRVALERRLQVMPVRKLAIPQHERDMMALLTLEPFHRGRIVREAWREGERLAGVVAAALRDARKQLLRNAPAPRRPAFHVGREPPTRMHLLLDQQRREEAAEQRRQLQMSLGRRPASAQSANRRRIESNAPTAASEKEQKPQPPQMLQQKPILGGFVADRLVLSLNRFEMQLQALFESVSERRSALKAQLGEIERVRSAAAASSSWDDPPTWTSSAAPAPFGSASGASSAFRFADAAASSPAAASINMMAAQSTAAFKRARFASVSAATPQQQQQNLRPLSASSSQRGTRIPTPPPSHQGFRVG